MLQIFDKNFSSLRPIQPSHKAVAVFNIEDAKLAFNYGNVDFVVVLNEKNGKFGLCYSLLEVINFLETDEEDSI